MKNSPCRRTFVTYFLVGQTLLQLGCAATQAQHRHEQRGERLGRDLTNQIAEIMASNKIYDTATPLLQEGIAEDPNNPRLHRLLGVVLRDRGVYEEALTELQLSWRLGPHHPDTAAAMNVPEGAQKATLAAGCFWGIEHMYRKDFGHGKGLLDARVGYIGGDTKEPSYRAVCSGRTGRTSSIHHPCVFSC